MNDANLSSTAALFLALGDPTRLRLLNLMREDEVCVSSFTTILGQSQPLVSRHLAYLRNAGVVNARRDGKWIHYSVSANLDNNTRRLVTELFKWMEREPTLSEERARYYQSVGLPMTSGKGSRANRLETSDPRDKEYQVEERDLVPKVSENSENYSGSNSTPDYVSVGHNELEDFLL